MIKAEHITKMFGKFAAVSDLSFTVKDGEIVGFLGPNGAGKSTTMNILTGYMSSTSGEVEIDGHNILTDTIAAKQSIGYLPEIPPLYGEMTVDEYLNFVYDLKGCTLNRKKHIDDVCNVTRIDMVRKRVIDNLSKGYQQRIGIAQAIIGNPKTIILDEPTIGLDPREIVEIRNLIRILGRDHSVILSTHILSEVQAVADRIIIINKGRIVTDDKTENITRKVNGASRIKAVICGPITSVISSLKTISGIRKVDTMAARELDANSYIIDSEENTDIRRDLFEICRQNNWPILSLEIMSMDLENIFLAVTSNDKKSAKILRK